MPKITNTGNISEFYSIATKMIETPDSYRHNSGPFFSNQFY